MYLYDFGDFVVHNDVADPKFCAGTRAVMGGPDGR
jgi:hypothetical protein